MGAPTDSRDKRRLLRAVPFLVLGVLGVVGLYVTTVLPPSPPTPTAPSTPPPASPTPPDQVPVAPSVPDAGPPPPPSGPITVVDDEYTRDRLLGEHPLALQWISWGKYGRVTIEDDAGLLRVHGRQDGRGGDFLAIDGVITHVEEKRFTFEGIIDAKVSHNAGGRVCRRDGVYHFRATGKRRYFRLREMNNPCDKTPRLVDYIDIFWTHSL